MKKMTKWIAVLVVVAAAAFTAWFALRTPRVEEKPAEQKVEAPKKKPIKTVSRPASPAKQKDAAKESGDADPGMKEGKDDADDDETEEDKRIDREEALVEAFDNMTDKFMDAEEVKEVSMDDVNRFHDLFRRVPEERKEECLHRALNLLPDSNVMLLAGILMDKEEKKELVELVFNDILNRDESVKSVLLNEIYKDKTHPCWADTAWVLDATGSAKEKQ